MWLVEQTSIYKVTCLHEFEQVPFYIYTQPITHHFEQHYPNNLFRFLLALRCQQPYPALLHRLDLEPAVPAAPREQHGAVTASLQPWCICKI